MSASDLQQDRKFIINGTVTAEYEIKKSRFIVSVIPCVSEEEALQELKALASQHPQANHLAYAWRILKDDGVLSIRIQDAGEPSGTAGRPILSYIEGAGLINATIGVIRYFGGVKLGAGGLTRAYGTAAKTAIEASMLIPWVAMTEFILHLDYSQFQMLEYQIKQCGGSILEQKFTDRVQVKVLIPESNLETLKAQFSTYSNS